jgi:hypothetical protein
MSPLYGVLSPKIQGLPKNLRRMMFPGIRRNAMKTSSRRITEVMAPEQRNLQKKIDKNDNVPHPS